MIYSLQQLSSDVLTHDVLFSIEPRSESKSARLRSKDDWICNFCKTRHTHRNTQCHRYTWHYSNIMIYTIKYNAKFHWLQNQWMTLVKFNMSLCVDSPIETFASSFLKCRIEHRPWSELSQSTCSFVSFYRWFCDHYGTLTTFYDLLHCSDPRILTAEKLVLSSKKIYVTYVYR